MIAVTVERNRYLQQHKGKTHAELLALRDAPRERTLQRLWKVVLVHDGDNRVTETRREPAGSVTILAVESPVFFDAIDLPTANACGYRTTADLREAWRAAHPRTDLAAVAWFVLGDWRDRDIFLNWSGRGGGDYTRNPRRAIDPDAPALTAEQMDDLAHGNRQKDEARRAAASAALAGESPSARLARLQRVVDRLGDDAAWAVRKHIEIIEQRVKRAEGRPRD